MHNGIEWLKNVCLAVLYFFFTFSCLFAPRIVAKLGPRCALALAASSNAAVAACGPGP